jgi:Spy/CpxP family protein refolding chaperone
MRNSFLVICVILVAALPGAARQQSSGGQQSPNDPMGENLFAPELIMQHQEELRLSDNQKNLLKVESRKAATRFTELQWQLQDEAEKLAEIVKRQHIDEQEALAELDKILDVEREIKHLQVALVVRLKNALTPEQQARLMEIKRKSPGK